MLVDVSDLSPRPIIAARRDELAYFIFSVYLDQDHYGQDLCVLSERLRDMFDELGGLLGEARKIHRQKISTI